MASCKEMLLGILAMASSGPQFVRYFGPVIVALKKLGGSGRPEEVRSIVASDLSVSDAEQSEQLESGASRFDNQVQWARFYLVRAGLIDSSRRGVWGLTDKGRMIDSLTHEESITLFRDVQSRFRKVQKDRGADTPIDETGDDPPAPEDTKSISPANYKEEVISLLRSLPPNGFERFCQRLLRESGFEEVSVTGRSGDGGIDGIGILQVNPLVSFKVLFQCKRYVGSVSSGHVRDFRGAMMGRADKGIILTTGTFTADAKREAIRDGVPPIELVDGEKLVRMLEDLELGLTPVKAYEVADDFFDEFQS